MAWVTRNYNASCERLMDFINQEGEKKRKIIMVKAGRKDQNSPADQFSQCRRMAHWRWSARDDWNCEKPFANMSPQPKAARPQAGFGSSRRGDRRWPVFAAVWWRRLRPAKWLIFLWLTAGGLPAPAQTNDSPLPTQGGGIAVSLVYDGSGSMALRVPGADRQPTPKFLIANKAINSIIGQLAAFSRDKQVAIQAGLVYFVGGKIQQAIPMTDLTPAGAAAFTNWAANFTAPAGGTPLGLAIREAQHQLESSPCLHRHILVITDGLSNAGIAPDRVVRQIRAGAHPSSVYFVAFDVNASVFDPAKAQGATVVGASDEAQLNAELNHILGRKILLEAE